MISLSLSTHGPLRLDYVLAMRGEHGRPLRWGRRKTAPQASGARGAVAASRRGRAVRRPSCWSTVPLSLRAECIRSTGLPGPPMGPLPFRYSTILCLLPARVPLCGPKAVASMRHDMRITPCRQTTIRCQPPSPPATTSTTLLLEQHGPPSRTMTRDRPLPLPRPAIPDLCPRITPKRRSSPLASPPCPRKSNSRPNNKFTSTSSLRSIQKACIPAGM